VRRLPRLGASELTRGYIRDTDNEEINTAALRQIMNPHGRLHRIGVYHYFNLEQEVEQEDTLIAMSYSQLRLLETPIY
jgi:hypothetical protein